MSEYLRMNTTTLAYLGDAAYELAIRKYLISKGISRSDKLHQVAIRYVNANAQARIIKALFDDLSPEEQTLVKRARNKKSGTKAKNADPVIYKWSTAFEALLGYYYISDQTETFDKIVEEAISIINKS